MNNSTAHYDEDRALTEYVWNWYQDEMTEFELVVGKAIVHRRKFGERDPQGAIVRRACMLDDPGVNLTLSEGPDAFRRRVRVRVLAEAGDRISVNRCPQCACVVRIPKARQCFWCGFDWHPVDAG